MKTASVKAFHRALDQWYRQHGRHDLPWRNTADPYHVYVSEIMLQQTQVKTVLARFYHPFLEQFPTLQALADAPQEAVMKQWEGLGYYSRARNLHAAAKAAAPALPASYEALMALPGIGKNTAHAVLAFGFHQPYAVMEANVKRIMHRLFAVETATTAELFEKAGSLLNRDEPFHYNQAMMDLGAMVCLPKRPLCHECPAQPICMGRAAPESYPAAAPKKPTPVRRKRVVVLRDARGHYYLTPRTSRFLGGLYGFIELEEDATSCHFNGQDYRLDAMQPLGNITQIYSHFRLDAFVYLATLDVGMNSGDWHPPEAMAKLPLSGAELKILRLLPLPCDARALQR